jgi:hypothetical protein
MLSGPWWTEVNSNPKIVLGHGDVRVELKLAAEALSKESHT